MISRHVFGPFPHPAPDPRLRFDPDAVAISFGDVPPGGIEKEEEPVW